MGLAEKASMHCGSTDSGKAVGVDAPELAGDGGKLCCACGAAGAGCLWGTEGQCHPWGERSALRCLSGAGAPGNCGIEAGKTARPGSQGAGAGSDPCGGTAPAAAVPEKWECSHPP